MNQLQIFQSNEFGQIRTLAIENEPWFVGKDVADALGYERTADAIRTHIDEDDKGVGKIQTPGGIQEMVIINESGLYSLIMSSKLPSAKKFKRWVTSEVLPSIRKHGTYITSGKLEDIMNDPDAWIKLLLTLKEERREKERLHLQIEADKPKTIFADAVTTSHTSILVGDLAKLLKQNGYSTGQQRLFETLRQKGYLIKNGNSKNMPTQRSMEMELFEVKESTMVNADGSVRIVKTTKVTGKGQVYFINHFLGMERWRND